MSLNRAQVISIIEEAFEGVPQPLEITLHVAEAYDSYDDDHDDEHRHEILFAGLYDLVLTKPRSR